MAARPSEPLLRGWHATATLGPGRAARRRRHPVGGPPAQRQRPQQTAWRRRIGAKIRQLLAEGRPQDQAVAIAMDLEARGQL